MTVVLTLLAVGIAAYFLFKGNKRRGAETVRAFVYMGGIAAGEGPAQANQVADFDMDKAPTEVIADAMRHLKDEYDGRQVSMIGEAYRQGMKPKLAGWYSELLRRDGPQRSSLSVPPNDAATVAADVQFATFYCASKLRWSTYTTEMPLEMSELIDGQASAATRADLAAMEQVYCQSARSGQQPAWSEQQALGACTKLLRSELSLVFSPLAVSRWVSSQNPELAMGASAAEITKSVNEVLAAIASDSKLRQSAAVKILSFSIQELFKAQHGVTIEQFENLPSDGGISESGAAGQ